MEIMGRVEIEEVEISDMQERGRPRDLLLLQVLQGGGATTKRVVGPVPNPTSAAEHVLDLELSLGVTTYTGEGSTAGSSPRSLSSSSSTSSMMRVLNQSPSNAGEGGLACGAADLPLMGPLVLLERSCSLPHEGEREARKVIWSALAKRRIESTKMQRNTRINDLQAEKRRERPAIEPVPKLLMKLPRAAAAAKCSSISEPLGFQSALGKRPLVHDMGIAKGPEPQLLEKKESASSELLPKLNETITQVISTVKAKGKEVNVAGNNAAESSCKKSKVLKNAFEYNGVDVMKLMPSVVTTGDGPNGRTIQGILYKYTAESVRIVCVCHGAFLSPEEFVSHSGRVDKQNPMKHIKVMSGRGYSTG